MAALPVAVVMRGAFASGAEDTLLSVLHQPLVYSSRSKLAIVGDPSVFRPALILLTVKCEYLEHQ